MKKGEAMTRRWCYRWQTVVVSLGYMIFLTPGRSQPQTNILIQSCSQIHDATNLQNFFSNLNGTLREVRRQLSNHNTYFATAEQTRNSEPVYVLAQCRNYMSTSDCVNCFDFADRSIRSCAAANGARAVLDGCFLRYESISFYDQETLQGNVGLCGNRASSPQSVFEAAVDGLLSNLVIATPKINGFYAAATAPVVGSNINTAYAIAQCAGTVTRDGCKRCLQVAHSNIKRCATDVIDGRAVDSGCFMRYSGSPFFANNKTTDITPFLRDGHSSKVAIVAASIGGLVLFILFLVFCLWYRLQKRSRKTEEDIGDLEVSVHYSYKDLQLATNNFSKENLLGKGGFGEVYKAILDDKNVVAVKKLHVQHSRAKEEFENEIKLISDIRHRYLLRLLGWSSEGSYLLLVLEYMPNGSLDQFLWGAKRGTLDWNQRSEIIFGIARGLAHLHNEFHVKIVHRDIKSSNILVGDDFKPKIADFGLARFQPEDQTHVSTKFAGTLGYTAPEYALHGILSDKVDTYSFGVVTLEIISGRSSTEVIPDRPSADHLLEHAWTLYEKKIHTQVVDETLNLNQYQQQHVMKIIEIALLCTQSPASNRPTMSEVVLLMLQDDQSVGKRQLTRPIFVTRPDRRIHIGSLKNTSGAGHVYKKPSQFEASHQLFSEKEEGKVAVIEKGMNIA